MKEYKVLVKQFMVKYADNKMPMRTMVGTIEKETPKAYFMKLYGKPEPSTKCLHCNRKLVHPVSLLYGIGPVCMGHMHMNPFDTEEELQEHYEELKSQMAELKWKGWIPKSQIVEKELISSELDEILEEASERFDVVFKYEGKIYRTKTNSEKLYEIRQRAEIIELEQVV